MILVVCCVLWWWWWLLLCVVMMITIVVVCCHIRIPAWADAAASTIPYIPRIPWMTKVMMKKVKMVAIGIFSWCQWWWCSDFYNNLNIAQIPTQILKCSPLSRIFYWLAMHLPLNEWVWNLCPMPGFQKFAKFWVPGFLGILERKPRLKDVSANSRVFASVLAFRGHILSSAVSPARKRM